ncbi:hypothetical protein GCM10023185_07070 [Hymenobacter saemangeumensis]|uniref:Uncharacterized protein n=1 Tax=Hymenobacter saemangeumensis TaxID=1084522 RepID=A0ABP8I2A1_9BACT
MSTPIEGWASTNPGTTKYHHYGPDGQSKCSYQKGTGTSLHFHPQPEQLTPAECCTSCDLHILKAKHPERFNNHPTLPIDRQSKWQQKQYGTQAPEAPAPQPTPPPAATQLTLF